MVQSATEFLIGRISPELAVFVISMLPVFELRGGLIAASILDMPWVKAAIVSIAGNLLPIPFILMFVRAVLGWMKTTRIFKKLAQKYEARANRGAGDILKKYPTRLMWALYIFVAIPLPMTGAWTGSLIASFLDIKPRRAFPAIAAGVCTAAVVMLIIAYAAPALLGFK